MRDSELSSFSGQNKSSNPIKNVEQFNPDPSGTPDTCFSTESEDVNTWSASFMPKYGQDS